MSDRPNGLTYAQAGVDIDAGAALVERIKPLAKSTQRPGAQGSLGGFGALFDLKAAGYDDPLLVTTTDGVGTKLKVAIETGIHDTVGIDLVAMCVNDLLAQGAEPLMFLDYFATGKLDVEAAATVVSGIAEGCRQAGCALVGGETAEMPGMYAAGDYDMAGFCVGAVDRDKVLPRMADQKPGDVLIGLGSTGPHSNGYSLVRRIVERSGLAWDAPAPFAEDLTLAQALLAPHLRKDRAAASEDRSDHGSGAHHRRRPDRKPAARRRRGPGRQIRLGRLGIAGGVRLAATGWRRLRPRTAPHLQLWRRPDADR